MLPRMAGYAGVTLLILGGVQVASAQTKLQDALLAQERKLIDAINRKDQAVIAEMLSEEGISITSRGKQTTSQIVKNLENLSFSKYQISDPKTIEVGPGAAILTYKFSWTGEESGRTPATTTVYATSVWRLRNGKWRSVFYQETPVAK